MWAEDISPDAINLLSIVSDTITGDVIFLIKYPKSSAYFIWPFTDITFYWIASTHAARWLLYRVMVKFALTALLCDSKNEKELKDSELQRNQICMEST